MFIIQIFTLRNPIKGNLDRRPSNSSKLGQIVFLKKVVESSNFLSSEKSPIDKIQVSQLIALLAATLEALRAPFIEKKQAEGFFRWLGKLAKKSIEKGVEKVVTDAMGDAANAGKDLIQHLPSDDVVTDLGEMI